MPVTSLGDMATALTFTHRTASLKHTIDRLTNELSGGQTSDVHGRLGGNYAYLADIDSSLIRLQSYSVAASEAQVTASAMQSGLGHISDIAAGLSSALLGDGLNTAHPTQSLGSDRARNDLGAVMTALNTTIAGRSLFAGTAVNTTPLTDSETLLNGLRTAVAGLGTPEDIRAAAAAWFDPGGGFDTSVYQGGRSDTPAISISDTRKATLSIRADDSVFRDVMRETALAALADDPALALSEADAIALRDGAGLVLIAVQDQLIVKQADLGSQEEMIENATTEVSSARLSLQATRASLLAADPFETAAGLEDAQFRLEALYAIAARSASLKLVNFL